MLGKQLARGFHQSAQPLGALTVGKMAGQRLISDVVGRGRGHGFHAVVPDQQMPVTYPGVKAQLGPTEFGVQRADQLGRLFTRNMTGRKIVHHLAAVGLGGKADQIAPKGNIGRPQLDPHAGRLNRRTAGVIVARVKTEQTHRAHIAAGRIAVGNRVGQPPACRERQSGPYWGCGHTQEGFYDPAPVPANRPCHHLAARRTSYQLPQFGVLTPSLSQRSRLGSGVHQ